MNIVIVLGRLGRSSRRSSGFSGVLERLGPSWDDLGLSWAALEPILEAILALLQASWPVLRRSCALLGATLKRLGPSCAYHAMILRRLGPLLGRQK